MGVISFVQALQRRDERELSRLTGIKQRRAREQGHTSGMHDRGGLAMLEDYHDADLLDEGPLVLGFDRGIGRYLFYRGDSSVICIGRAGIGKGSTCVQTNLAWIGRDTSVIVVDTDHENYRVSAGYRQRIGHTVIADNPAGTYRIPHTNICPLSHIRQAGLEGNFNRVVRRAEDFQFVCVPASKDTTRREESWILDGARKLSLPVLEFFALDRPHQMNMSAIRDFLFQPVETIIDTIVDNTSSTHVLQQLTPFREELKVGADKQLFWKAEKLRDAFAPYAPGTDLGDACVQTPFDISRMKREPVTAYLQCPSASQARHADDMARKLTAMVEQLADCDGDQKIIVLMDEASQFPQTNLPGWINTLRKQKISFYCFFQTIGSIEQRFGKAGRDGLMASVDVLQYLSVDNVETARDLSARSGTQSVYRTQMQESAETQNVSATGSEEAREVLAVSEVLKLAKDEQFIVKSGCKLIKAQRAPWWELELFSKRLRHFSEFDDTPRY